MIYDYRQAIKDDIENYINDEYSDFKLKDYTKDEAIEELRDRLFIEDSVTGNASGSYTFNSYQAMENLFGNEDLIEEVDREFSIDEDKRWDWEYLDVSIRCYLLYECISELLDEYDDEDFKSEDEDETE